MTERKTFPAMPASWSGLTWSQLCGCWRCKMRYGGNPDVARAAALLELLGLEVRSQESGVRSQETGEAAYLLEDGDGGLWTVTPRELSQMAKAALPWFDWPYGDRGDEAVKDESGKVIREARDGVRGYVNPNWRGDAMMLPEDTVTVQSSKFKVQSYRRFALPQVACNNLTWQQYRSLQAISPQLFQEGLTEDEAIDLQAQFLAHSLVPRSLALLDTGGNSIRLRPHWEYTYDAARAEGMVPWFRKRLKAEHKRWKTGSARSQSSIIHYQLSILYHVCLQCYQTALTYYAAVYPLLFNDDGKKSKMQDALQGEVGTINTVMKYAGYAEQQQVYDSNLPFILDILNTMTKEAKQIEAMNAKIKSKR